MGDTSTIQSLVGLYNWLSSTHPLWDVWILGMVVDRAPWRSSERVRSFDHSYCTNLFVLELNKRIESSQGISINRKSAR